MASTLDDIPLSSLTIYNRRAFSWLLQLRETATSDAERFIGNELPSILDAALGAPTNFWMNSQEANRRAGRKVSQLHMARSFNFATPSSVVTNDPAVFHRLERERVSLLCKPIGSQSTYSGRFTYAAMLSNEVGDIDGALRACPVLIQHAIEKVRDIRVTAVGAQVFGAAALSRLDLGIDWRFAPSAVQWSEWSVPSAVASFVEAMLREFGLAFGAFDFVEDTAGNIMFLELNPNGQWLWIQQETGQDIASAIARTLMAHDE